MKDLSPAPILAESLTLAGDSYGPIAVRPPDIDMKEEVISLEPGSSSTTDSTFDDFSSFVSKHLESDRSDCENTSDDEESLILSESDPNMSAEIIDHGSEEELEKSSSGVSSSSSSKIKQRSDITNNKTDEPPEDSYEEIQVIQTTEYYQAKTDKDRAKRFEFLLKQTEIWGHFLKPAYEEALSFQTGESSELSASSSQQGSSTGKRTKTKNHLFSALPVANTPISQVGQSSKSVVAHFDSTPPFIISESGSMRDYQVRGLNWLISLYEKGLSGILADEMGLGKTLQSISLLGYLKHYKKINGPHLIIAPKSTLTNWMREVERWCPTLKTVCLIGNKEERKEIIKNQFRSKRWNVCITSYEIARIEKSALAKVNYHYIIIDEAQKIKNENSLLSLVVRSLKSSARLLLTGTPLQNNLHELWALLNFLLPDVFSSSDDFDSWFNESTCMDNQGIVNRLHTILRPFLLRRIKTDVEKSLPPKSEMRIYVQMTEMQRDWYRKVLINDINVINKTTGRPTKKNLHNVIMHIRKVCNHPYLFQGAEPEPFTTDSHLVTNSGKMIVLDKLLLRLQAQGSRVLLFSQMTRVLDIIQDYCIWRGFEHCRLDGDTHHDIRQEDIDEFNAPNSKKFIYLLSTRAGGLGINLATANIVILYDSDWNGQMDLQAMDRAHRIGQTKEVKVFRFVCQDTAEEKIVERAAQKLHLDKMVIQQGRLVGANTKIPSAIEMLNVARFGAENILKSGENAQISDADIDTILAQSKLRSDEFDRRLNEMSKEDNLKDLKIEQVELNYKPTQPDENDIFDFEGLNYRELRKTRARSIINHAEDDGNAVGESEKRSRKCRKVFGMEGTDAMFQEAKKTTDLEVSIESEYTFNESDEPPFSSSEFSIHVGNTIATPNKTPNSKKRKRLLNDQKVGSASKTLKPTM